MRNYKRAAEYYLYSLIMNKLSIPKFHVFNRDGNLNVLGERSHRNDSYILNIIGKEYMVTSSIGVFSDFNAINFIPFADNYDLTNNSSLAVGAGIISYLVDPKLGINTNRYELANSYSFSEFIEDMKKQSGFKVGTADDFIDFMEYIKNIKIINIHGLNINNNLLEKINCNFPQIKSVRFFDCKLSSEIDFSKLNVSYLYFTDMEIDLKIFDKSSVDYGFNRCIIKNSGFTTLHSKYISFNLCDMDYKKIFLTSRAFDLKKLSINNFDEADENNNYQFIPDFAPNIEKISIEGKLSSSKFLTALKNIVSIDIKSGENILGLSYAIIKDEIDVDKYKDDINTVKILHRYAPNGELSIRELSMIIIKRIIKLSKLYNRLSYTKTEEKAYKEKSFKSIADYILSNKFVKTDQGNYLCYKGKLIFVQRNPYIDIDTSEEYHIVKEKYAIRINDLFSKSSKSILTAKDCVYHPDGRPIIFNKPKRQISDTPDEAINFINMHIKEETRGNKEIPYSVNDEQYDDMVYQSQVKDYLETFLDVSEKSKKFIPSISTLCFGAEEMTTIRLSPQNLKEIIEEKYGEELDFLYKYLDEYCVNESYRKKSDQNKNNELDVMAEMGGFIMSHKEEIEKSSIKDLLRLLMYISDAYLYGAAQRQCFEKDIEDSKKSILSLSLKKEIERYISSINKLREEANKENQRGRKEVVLSKKDYKRLLLFNQNRKGM